MGKCQLPRWSGLLLPKIVCGSHTITLMPNFDNGKTGFFEETGFGQTWPTQGLNDRKASMRTDICKSCDYFPPGASQEQKVDPPSQQFSRLGPNPGTKSRTLSRSRSTQQKKFAFSLAVRFLRLGRMKAIRRRLSWRPRFWFLRRSKFAVVRE